MLARAAADPAALNSQNVCNILCALATLGIDPEPRVLAVLDEHIMAHWDLFELIHLSQLHQVSLACAWLDFAAGQRFRCFQNYAFCHKCRLAFEVREGTRSKLQESVCNCMQAMGLIFIEEARDPLSGYLIDFLVEDGSRFGCALEVDGPTHFIRCCAGRGERENGSTLLKRRLLQRIGYRTASVRYGEWRNWSPATDSANQAHLRSAICMDYVI